MQEEFSDGRSSWAESVEATLARLKVAVATGLDEENLAARLRKYGPNRLREHRPRSDLLILVDQFRSLVVGLLAAAAVAAFAFGQWIEGASVIVVIALNAAIGFFTERHARRSMDALFALGVTQARVRRCGEVCIVSAESLVPGDIMLVEAGDMISADLRLIESSRLLADESALTGESAPVDKDASPVAPDTPLAERRSLLHKGTGITSGTAMAVVVATGIHTELGRIAELMLDSDDTETPLEKRLDRLGHRLVGVTIAIAILVIMGGMFAGRDTFLMIQTGIALAVAAIPEGLPIVATIALAGGLRRMAARNVLVQRLASVETLGSTGVICTDKTGTLTENRMTLVCLEFANGSQHVVAESGDEVMPLSPAGRAFEIGALCNSAILGSQPLENTPSTSTGDPMELALLRAAQTVGLDRSVLIAREPETAVIAFDPEARRMATLHRLEDGRCRIAVKGAPEAVLACSTRLLDSDGERPLPEEERMRLLQANDTLAADGLRVLALAERIAAGESEAQIAPFESLVFVALAAFRDPPRDDVAPAIAACRAAGVDVVMVTGDQPNTARAIARAVGIVDADDARVLKGDAIATSETTDTLETRVFARVDPAQKLSLIDLHHEAGRIVAMTGDGVNDAPALKAADIGVAMGLRGTEVAKEAADMVLADDAFSSIVAAIHEGRIIFANIRTFVLYLMSCNVGEVMIVGVAATIGSTLPLLPLQILFLNLVTDVFPALALAVGAGAAGAMHDPPRDPAESILERRHWRDIVAYGCVITITVLGALTIAERVLGLKPEEAVTVSFLTLAFAQLWHVFDMRTPASTFFKNEITSNSRIWAALAFCTTLILSTLYIPPVATALGVNMLDAQSWILVLIASAIPLVFGQTLLAFRRRRA